MTHTVETSNPIDLAHACLAAAEIHKEAGDDLRAAGDHPAAGIAREHQRHYMKRADLYVAIAQAESLRSIADDLNRLALAR